MYYIAMTDSFMSGWGMAEGRSNRFVVQCDNREQAQQIERAARGRDEMKRIQWVSKCPKSNDRMLVSVKHYSELGDIWQGGVTA
jgi:hypothetical protein